MIEILNRDDIYNIKNSAIREYLKNTIQNLSPEFHMPQDGYFVVIENFEELTQNPISLTHCILPSIYDGLIDNIEVVHQENNIIEIIFIINNEFSISLVMFSSILPNHLLSQVFENLL
jgi:hypothetical protein